MIDKDYIAWLREYSDRENALFGRTEVPENFYSMHGTGPFIPTDLNQSVSTHIYDANPNYFREGLPLLDRYQNVVIKDIGSRFTALGHREDPLHGRGKLEHDSGAGRTGPSGFPGPHRNQQPAESLGQDDCLFGSNTRLGTTCG